MKTFATFTLACLLLASSAYAAEQTVSEHSATLTVRPGELRMDRARLVSEKIKRVINLRGNNPLNPINPLQDPAVVAAAGGGGGGGGVDLTNACVGSAPAGQHPDTEAAIASIELDAVTGTCQLWSGYSGNTLRLSDPPSEPPLFSGTVDAYPAGAWTFVAPSPVGGKLRFSAGEVVTVRLRAPNAAVIDMQVQFAIEGLGRRLHVLSTTPVQ